MQLKEILQKTTQFLKDKGSPSARLDTELLLAAALKWERIKLYLNYEYPLTDEEMNIARDYVRRRANGEPVAYILGFKDFYNHAFKVNNAVLIPRPETETLVETAIELVSAETEEIIRVVDLGTGSGCIGLSLLAGCPETQLLAVDISPLAIEVAKENAERMEVSDRAHFLTTDAGMLETEQVESILGGRADMILANPPYISPDDPAVEKNVKKFEPQQALFSPENGLAHVREWADAALRIGRVGAMTMFEIGAEQGSSAAEIFKSTGRFQDVEIVKDLFGRERFIRARVAVENQTPMTSN